MRRLIAITEESYSFREHERIVRMLRSNSFNYVHIRKPNMNERDMREYLSRFPKDIRHLLCLNDHQELAKEYGIGGIHINSRFSFLTEETKGLRISKSCHSIEEAIESQDKYDYCFLSPIFDSISKKGYKSAFDHSEIRNLFQKNVLHDNVFALSGVTTENIPYLEDMGFNGVAMLGAAWQLPRMMFITHQNERYSYIQSVKKSLSVGIKFLQGYGLTETAPIAALTPEYEPSRYASTGKAVLDTDIKVINPNEDGEGELLIKGPTVMLGYYEDEEATKEAMQDGYFCSGDIGKIDADGYIYITGRSKNVIVTQNGKNIYPEEIELLLNDIPEVSECMVYGQKEEKKNDKELVITAKIIPDYKQIEELHGSDLTEEEIQKLIWEKVKETNKKLTSYKAVKKIEIKKDEFEKTTTMKIKRYAEMNKESK